MQLRPYQTQLNNLIITHLWESKRIIAQATTGAGKTVIASSLVQRFTLKFPEKVVVFCVHRAELVGQTQNKLRQFGIDAVCIVAGMSHIPKSQVYIAMVESLESRMPENIGLLIVDESHIGNHLKIIRAMPESCLVLGFSATPVSLNKKEPLNKYFKFIVTGPKTKTLIADGYLAEPLLFTRSGIDKKKVSMQGGDYSGTSQYAQFSQPKQLHNILSAYQQLSDNKKTIIFCCNIQHMIDVTELFSQYGYPVRCVDGGTDGAERKDTLSWFRDTPGAVLCNVGVATTGFDEPTIECVILAFLTKSIAKYNQCIGRGARISPGKKTFTIIDLGGNYLEHGLWEEEVDWHYMFENPGKAGKGVAPTKVCINEECGCIIHLSSTACSYCGQEMPRINVYDEKEAIFLYRGPRTDMARDVVTMQEQGHSKWMPLMKTVDSAVREAKKLTGTVTPAMLKTIQEAVYPSAETYYKTVQDKKFTGPCKGFVNKLINAKITALFV